MNRRILGTGLFCGLFAGFALIASCSDDGANPGGRVNTGGSPGSGGTNGTGGNSNGTGGNVSETGGSGETGGTSSTGGSSGTGGAEATDGGTAGGGTGGAAPGGDGGGTGDITKWKYFSVITLDTTATGANVTGDVPKYPVAIALTATNFDFTQAKDKGADLRFTTPDGTMLPYAIEFWDSAAKVAAVWVKVDVKGNDKTQSITMSWGNADAPDASDSHKVFDTADGFVGVWHLSETGSTTAGGYKDATANGADATGVATTADSVGDGRVGKAANLSHASNQYLKVADMEKNKLFDTFNQTTFSIWVHPKSHTVNYQCMFSKGEGSFRIHYYGLAEYYGNRHLTEICVEGPNYDECPVNEKSGTSVEPGKWWHLVGVTDHPKINYYINGAPESSDSDDSPWKSDATKPVVIGNNSSGLGRSFDGIVDEARFMNVPKDTNWVKLEYESQKEAQKFSTVGSAQTR
jgi:hypothetical protein